jgi:hypothetical protein
MNNDTIDRQSFDNALMRGDVHALDTLGFPFVVPAEYLPLVYRRYALAIGRGTETFTDDDRKHARERWVMAGRPGAS